MSERKRQPRVASMLEDSLESLVDGQDDGLQGVLDALALVCRAKAEHLESNWQDKAAAKWWTSAAKKIERIANTVGV
jgi:hypothetical protein